MRRREPEAMDGARGFAALGFALGLWLSLTPLAGIAARLDLFADFILLAAGFICARAHGPALSRHEGVARFLLSRVMRFLPLNAAVLSGLLLIATVSGRGVSPEEGRGFFASLAFIDILTPGVDGWTPAGWVMAAEVQLSALFAAFCLLGLFSGAMGRAAIFVAVLAAMVSRGEGDPYADLLARVFAAFMLGALAQGVMASRSEALRRVKARAGTGLEFWAVGSGLSFLALAPEAADAAAPAALLPALLFLMKRPGALARALRGKAPQALGRMTWPLMMAPALLLHPAAEFAASGGARAEAALLFATPAYLLALLALAVIARRWIEAPTQTAMWAWLDRTLPVRSRTEHARA